MSDKVTDDSGLGGPGEVREGGLPRAAYYSEVYLSLPQLYAQAFQIEQAYQMASKSVVEIGIGNGLVASMLRGAGMDVLTVDINPNLEPDICASFHELGRLSTEMERFDLVLCCEVLEHLPFEMIDACLATIARLGSAAFITLPRARRAFGFSLACWLPRMAPRRLAWFVDSPRIKRRFSEGHCWELGSSAATSEKATLEKLQQYFERVDVGRVPMVPHLTYFRCT